MVCEQCKIVHDGSYGSGRFCSKECARAFSSSKYIKQEKQVSCIVCGVEITVDKKASDNTCKCDNCRKQPKSSKYKLKKTKQKKR